MSANIFCFVILVGLIGQGWAAAAPVKEGGCNSRVPASNMGDGAWLIDSMPDGGWYVPMYGFTTHGSVESAANSISVLPDGPNKMCWKMNAGAAGGSTPNAVVTPCTYENVAVQKCNFQKSIEIPFLKKFASNIRLVIVKTDAKRTYAVISYCIAGSLESWAVLSNSKTGPPEPTKKEIVKYLETIGAKQMAPKDLGKATTRLIINDCSGMDADAASSVSNAAGAAQTFGQ